MNDRSSSPVCKRYVQAWTDALRGGALPLVEDYLSAVDGRERDKVRVELLAVEPFCRELHARFTAARSDVTADLTGSPAHDTVDNTAVDGAAAALGAATGEYPPRAEATGEFIPGVATAVPPRGETAIYDSGPPVNTIDAAAPVDGNAQPGLATGAFELNVPPAPSTQEQAKGKPRSKTKYPHVPGYEILGVLGRGGMGVVYKARQTGLDRLVALKMILAGEHASQLMLDRFQAEAQAVAHLQHPHIVQIYEVGELDGLPYFSLEFVDGGTLEAKMDHKPQPPRIAAEMVEALARAMHHAHQHHVIHRDLKPGNVLLQNLEGDAPTASISMHDRSLMQVAREKTDVWDKAVVPKITDFGLAKRLEGDSSQTRTGTILGTPSYMAPEQARGDARNVGPLADVYALGAILYEMMTGRPPFLAATPMETVMAVIKEEPVPPSQLQPRLPRDLETICLKCLQKETVKRYETAGELADDLHRYLSGESIKARPVSSAERFWRWCKRNPKVTMLSATILSLLIMGLVGALAFAMQLNKQKLAAETARDSAFGSTDLALESLALMVRESQQKLEGVPNSGPIRKELLKLAMDQLEKVEQGFVKSEGKTERIEAAVYGLMGTMLWDEPGSRGKAAEYYQRCYDIVEPLYRAMPDNDKAKKNLGVATFNLGNVSLAIRNNPQEARQRYEKALALLGELAEKPSFNENLTTTEVNLALDEVLRKLVSIQFALGNPAAARPYAERSLKVNEKVLAEDPTKPDWMLRVGTAYLTLADVCRRLKDDAGYRQNAEASLPPLEAAYKANRFSLVIRSGLAKASADSGDYHLRQKDAAGAEPFYRRNLEMVKPQQDPSVGLQQQLAMAYYRAGTAELMLGKVKEADANYAECLRLREEIGKSLNDRRSRIQIMVALARCGRYEQMEKKRDEILQKDGKTPANMREIALAYGAALARLKAGKKPEQLTTEERDLANRFASEAIKALTAATSGVKVDLVDLDTDPDLFALHEMPEYKKWKEEAQNSAPVGQQPSIAGPPR